MLHEMHRRNGLSVVASIRYPAGQASAALLSVAQEEQQVSAAQQPQEHQAQQAFRALPAWSQQQEVSLQAARRVV